MPQCADFNHSIFETATPAGFAIPNQLMEKGTRKEDKSKSQQAILRRSKLPPNVAWFLLIRGTSAAAAN